MKENLETFAKLRILLEVEGIGPSKLFNLLSKFTSLDNLINASYNQLIMVDGISQTLANKILKKIDEYPIFLESAEKELNYLEKIKGNWVSFWSEDYPENLKNIFATPIILYYKGTLSNKDKNSVAIVGTRMPSNYGKKNAYDFAKNLSSQGISVISGLARGIDSSAHWGTVENNGRTVAIIGSGLDVIYPSENKKLFNKITENGAVITEYVLGTKPDAQNFPKRNRIISGISLGTLVIETKLSGGALQTAGFAIEQNREVFAIPGNLGNVQSEGCNLLIQRSSAKLVTNIEDILIELKLKIAPKIGENIPKPVEDLNIFEQKIFDVLSHEPKHIDLISNESKINSADCLVHLLSLEFRDLVKQLPGKIFVKY